jgi:hypothetical protein
LGFHFFEIHQHETRAFAREQMSNGRADATGTAQNDRYLTGKFHDAFLLSQSSSFRSQYGAEPFR